MDLCACGPVCPWAPGPVSQWARVTSGRWACGPVGRCAGGLVGQGVCGPDGQGARELAGWCCHGLVGLWAQGACGRSRSEMVHFFLRKIFCLKSFLMFWWSFSSFQNPFSFFVGPLCLGKLLAGLASPLDRRIFQTRATCCLLTVLHISYSSRTALFPGAAGFNSVFAGD